MQSEFKNPHYGLIGYPDAMRTCSIFKENREDVEAEKYCRLPNHCAMSYAHFFLDDGIVGNLDDVSTMKLLNVPSPAINRTIHFILNTEYPAKLTQFGKFRTLEAIAENPALDFATSGFVIEEIINYLLPAFCEPENVRKFIDLEVQIGVRKEMLETNQVACISADGLTNCLHYIIDIARALVFNNCRNTEAMCRLMQLLIYSYLFIYEIEGCREDANTLKSLLRQLLQSPILISKRLESTRYFITVLLDHYEDDSRSLEALIDLSFALTANPNQKDNTKFTERFVERLVSYIDEDDFVRALDYMLECPDVHIWKDSFTNKLHLNRYRSRLPKPIYEHILNSSYPTDYKYKILLKCFGDTLYDVLTEKQRMLLCRWIITQENYYFALFKGVCLQQICDAKKRHSFVLDMYQVLEELVENNPNKIEYQNKLSDITLMEEQISTIGKHQNHVGKNCRVLPMFTWYCSQDFQTQQEYVFVPRYGTIIYMSSNALGYPIYQTFDILNGQVRFNGKPVQEFMQDWVRTDAIDSTTKLASQIVFEKLLSAYLFRYKHEDKYLKPLLESGIIYRVAD